MSFSVRKLIVMALLCASVARAQQPDYYAEAVRAFKAGRYGEAAPLFEQAFATHEPPLGVQEYLGNYFSGEIRSLVDRSPEAVLQQRRIQNALNREKAIRWYTKPAEAGCAWSQYGLGHVLLGVDDEQATRWLLAAGTQGFDVAPELSGLFRRGVGVSANLHRACVWQIVAGADMEPDERLDCPAKLGGEEYAVVIDEAHTIIGRRDQFKTCR
jgi:TPR repeat protein